MVIELSDEELEIVRTLVEGRIRELGPEIHHTSHRDFRNGLEELKQKLEALDARFTAGRR